MTKTTEAVAEERVRELRKHFAQSLSDSMNMGSDGTLSCDQYDLDLEHICAELLTSRQQIGEMRRILEHVASDAWLNEGGTISHEAREKLRPYLVPPALGAP